MNARFQHIKALYFYIAATNKALRFFEKMKLIEIAEILGQNPATIRSQLARALSKLRKELRAAGRLEP